MTEGRGRRTEDLTLRLVRVQFSTTQAYVIEVGDQYLRFIDPIRLPSSVVRLPE